MDGKDYTAHLVRTLVCRLIQEGFDPQDIPEFVKYLCRKILLQPPVNLEEINDVPKASGENGFRIDSDLLKLIRACLVEISLRIPACLRPGPPDALMSRPTCRGPTTLYGYINVDRRGDNRC
jgi:hypothetical protein